MIDIHAFIVSELLPSGKLYIPRRGKNMFSAGGYIAPKPKRGAICGEVG